MGRLGSILSLVACTLGLCVWAHTAEHPVPLGKNPDQANCLECHTDKNKGKYVHSAIAMGCTTCHTLTSESDRTQVNLVSPINQICLTCHEKSTDKVLHGPSAEGECVACHSPHASDQPDQLLADRQDLCLGCHARTRLKENARKKQVTTPWGVTLTFAQMQGWQYLNLNKTLTANHPVEGHPVTGPNTALGKDAPDITCLSCHQPHHSKSKYLMPPNVANQTALCETCHNPLKLH